MYLTRLKLSSSQHHSGLAGGSPSPPATLEAVCPPDGKLLASARSISLATESTAASAAAQPPGREDYSKSPLAMLTSQRGVPTPTRSAPRSAASGASSPRTLDPDVAARSEITPPSTPDRHRSSQALSSSLRVDGQRTPRTVQQCGQCANRPADLYCEQCDELFCSGCAQAIHSRGKLAQHRLRFHCYNASQESRDTSRRPSATSLCDPIQSGKTGQQDGDLQTLRRQFWACSVHPSEPLQFFCLRCECACICAECALHGDHAGHEVLNIRAALVQLPERRKQLQSQASARSTEVQAIIDEAQAGRRHLTELSGRVRQGLRDQCDKLRRSLRQEAMIAGLEDAANQVMSRLEHRDESITAIRLAHAQLLAHHRSGDAVQALTSYAKLRSVLAAAPPSQTEAIASEAMEDRAIIQQRIDEKVAGVEALTRRIQELSPTYVNDKDGMAWPQQFTLSGP